MAVKECLLLGLVLPKVTWAAPLVPAVGLQTAKAFYRGPCTRWCKGRVWADCFNVHPQLAAAVLCLRRTAGCRISGSTALDSTVRHHAGVLGLEVAEGGPSGVLLGSGQAAPLWSSAPCSRQPGLRGARMVSSPRTLMRATLSELLRGPLLWGRLMAPGPMPKALSPLTSRPKVIQLGNCGANASAHVTEATLLFFGEVPSRPRRADSGTTGELSASQCQCGSRSARHLIEECPI